MKHLKNRFACLCVGSLILVQLNACKKTGLIPRGYQQGVLRDLTGLDGCGWMIQLADSNRLEPVNLNEFDIELKEDKPVVIKYHVRKDLGSYCMAGTVVELDDIK